MPIRSAFAAAVLAVATVVPAGAVAFAAPARAADSSSCSLFSGATLSPEATGRLTTLTQQAGAVFEGRVTLPATVAADAPLRVTVSVLASWKGVAAPSTASVTLQPGACRSYVMAHRSGDDYVFLVHRGAGAWVASGTAPRVLPRTEALATALGAPAQSAQPDASGPVVFTPVSTAHPTSFLRLAIPGLALVVIGVFGLGLLRRWASR